MAFKVNDWAVHPLHGVGRVIRLEKRRFTEGPKVPYYNFKIPTGNVWVPVDGARNGLRRLIAKADLKRYRRLLRSRPKKLSDDHRKRQAALEERLKENSFGSKCKLVRDLSAFGWYKNLSESNLALLRKALDALCAEWSTVTDLTEAEANREVMDLLEKCKGSYYKGD